MIEALVGMGIASMAATALIIAIAVQTKTIKNSSKYNLSISEQELVRNAGYSKNDLKVLQIDIDNIK